MLGLELDGVDDSAIDGPLGTEAPNVAVHSDVQVALVRLFLKFVPAMRKFSEISKKKYNGGTLCTGVRVEYFLMF